MLFYDEICIILDEYGKMVTFKLLYIITHVPSNPKHLFLNNCNDDQRSMASYKCIF